jgi:hypothetical protein
MEGKGGKSWDWLRNTIDAWGALPESERPADPIPERAWGELIRSTGKETRWGAGDKFGGQVRGDVAGKWLAETKANLEGGPFGKRPAWYGDEVPAGAPGEGAGGGATSFTTGDLMKVRSILRDGMRTARASQDYDRLKLLEHAEDTVTGALKENLSPEDAAALDATDRQYARLMTLENAVARGGPEGEFSPRQLALAVKGSAGKRAYTQGKGGDLQQLAQDMSSVFDQRVPPTGMRAVVLSGAPKIAFGPAARLLNQPGVRSGLLPGGSFSLPYPEQAPAQSMAQIPTLAQLIAAALRTKDHE